MDNSNGQKYLVREQGKYKRYSYIIGATYTRADIIVDLKTGRIIRDRKSELERHPILRNIVSTNTLIRLRRGDISHFDNDLFEI